MSRIFSINKIIRKKLELLEAALLVATVKGAMVGNPKDKEHLAAMNKIRAENGRPSVEEELEAILKAGAK